MSNRNWWGLWSLFGVLALLNGSLATAAEPPFPMTVGTRWVYDAGQVEVVEEIVAVERINDEVCLKIETRVKDTTLSFEHIAVRPDGLYRVTIGGEAIEPPVCFFKFSPKQREKWTVQSKVGDIAVTGQYTAGASLVTVPAGRYSVTTSRGNRFPAPNENLDLTYFYAPGIGKVKQIISNGSKTSQLVLKEFQAAPKP